MRNRSGVAAVTVLALGLMFVPAATDLIHTRWYEWTGVVVGLGAGAAATLLVSHGVRTS
jgi:hypothetical protein